jgi:L-threonylcarbamoyladenylate synthase
VDVVLDGGPCTIGLESTIVDCSGAEPAVLRVGGIPRSRIDSILGATVPLRAEPGAAPGTLPSHYAPRARVVIVERGVAAARAAAILAAGDGVALLAPAPAIEGLPAGVAVLDAPVDVDDYARSLYARLRDADRRGADVILVVPPEPTGIGEAVLDRLRRAAATPHVRSGA